MVQYEGSLALGTTHLILLHNKSYLHGLKAGRSDLAQDLNATGLVG